ncbi:eukaryotic translation initiation factor 2-alpha kinase 3 [Rosa chinensis]|nr:eukaryotic translation initiation factor 2-alpha kinase 3 [Rosa chinensis]
MEVANPIQIPYVPPGIICPDTGVTIQTYQVSNVDERTYSKFRSEYDVAAEEFIGAVAFGVVVRCKNLIDNQTYAIKKISIGNRDNTDGYGNYRDLLRESIILATFDHPAVVRYHSTWMECTFVGTTGGEPDIVETNPCLYIQQQLCESTLEQKMRSAELSKEECAYIFSQVARGLAHIHSHNIMHGDLGRGNIFLNKNQAKIGDFGLSRIIGEGDDVIHLGNPPPPYAADDKCVNAKADVYSLGILLVQMFLNIRTDSEASKVFPDLKKEEPVFPAYWPNGVLKTWVTNMLKKNPSERPSSSDIVENLRKIEDAIQEFDS